MIENNKERLNSRNLDMLSKYFRRILLSIIISGMVARIEKAGAVYPNIGHNPLDINKGKPTLMFSATDKEKYNAFLPEDHINEELFHFADDTSIKFHMKMFFSPDSIYYINDKFKRVIVDSVSMEEFKYVQERGQNNYKKWKKAISTKYGIDAEELFFSKGKSFHYDFDKVEEDIKKSKEIFVEEGVDPLYAELILSIESPNGNTSSAQAKGKFQFMKETARRYGLVVNPKRDDRLDISKSARAAAQFLGDQEVIIKGYLEELGISIESDVYLKLLTLNSYQTGGLNIYALLKYMRDKRGLNKVDATYIREMWNTEISDVFIYRDGKKYEASFKLQSRQYTQIAVAAWIYKQKSKKELSQDSEDITGISDLTFNEDSYALFGREDLNPGNQKFMLAGAIPKDEKSKKKEPGVYLPIKAILTERYRIRKIIKEDKKRY